VVEDPTVFVPLSARGRRFSEEFLVRLGDADERGVLRLDAAARYLQDVATDDWSDADVESSDTWVVRRTTLRRVDERPWPRYLETVALTTWCGGTGAAWAERRTDVSLDGERVLEAVALWVPVDATGHPLRLRESFFGVYGEDARARRISGRVSVPPMGDGATRRPWPLRAADLDMVGHVNNAAVWEALSEVVTAPLAQVSVTHHGALEREDDVELVSAPGVVWLTVGGEVRVSATYAPS
jgi:acyl-ACP thioesterase